ncbi:hypothetical protein ABZ499_31385 [Streptomyces sp. NPDC019990]|uniref:hypothetical protein n=1 Tax=Streptomyces sp. NPDC019990 TaxID=3154693 RepID=UPI0034029B9A
MTDTLLHVGTAACFAGCGALALAAQRCARRPAALAEPARLHVSDVEAAPFPAGTGGLDVVGSYPVFEAELFDTGLFQYCPEDLRVTRHTTHPDGVLCCSDCGPQGDT